MHEVFVKNNRDELLAERSELFREKMDNTENKSLLVNVEGV
jgi:hypothetical protein